MRSLNDIVNESAINDIHKLSKGDTIYMLRESDDTRDSVRAVKVKIKSVDMNEINATDVPFWIYSISLDTNSYGIFGFDIYSAGKDEERSCELVTIRGEKYYIAVSTQAIKEYINAASKVNLNVVLHDIEEEQKKLAKLIQEKDKLEKKINLKITESLK